MTFWKLTPSPKTFIQALLFVLCVPIKKNLLFQQKRNLKRKIRFIKDFDIKFRSRYHAH